MNREIYDLPTELQFYIVSYIPFTNCVYCHICLLSFNKDIYCSNYCYILHSLVILNRIIHILYFSIIIQLKLFISLFINFFIIFMTIVMASTFIKVMYNIYYYDLLFNMELCDIY